MIECQVESEIRTEYNVIEACLPPPSLFMNDVRIWDKCDNVVHSLNEELIGLKKKLRSISNENLLLSDQI